MKNCKRVKTTVLDKNMGAFLRRGIIKILQKISKACEYPAKFGMPQWIGRCWYWIMIWVGRFEYAKLVRQYPGCIFLYTPTASSGDLCYVRRSMPHMLKVNGIEEPVIVLVEESTADVAQLLGFETILPVSKITLFPIAMMHTLYGGKAEKLFNCYPWEMLYQPHIKNPLQVESLFDLKKSGQQDANIFSAGKNIVLAPYEKTISLMGEPVLTDLFWEKTAAVLQEKGYHVYTNCKKDSGEIPVKGTKVIDMVSQMLGAIAYVDGVITVRSGLADLLCDIPVRQIILYPSTEWMDQFQLGSMANHQMLEEISYQEFMPELNGLVKVVTAGF